MAKKEVNYYKYVTFILLGFFIILGTFYGFNVYISSVYNEGFAMGQTNAIIGTIDTINKNGYITFANDNNESITLVSSLQLQVIREDTIKQIMNYIENKGSVSLYNNETEMILIEYQSPQQHIDLAGALTNQSVEN